MTIDRLFFSQGNREAIEGVDRLRLAKITSVNTEDMVAEIEFLGESTGKTRVPLPMPMAYPGGGIYAVPARGAVVIVGLRAMQDPMILAYYPFNTYRPDSFYAISQQIFGIPDTLSEGDIFARAKADVARCTVCNVTSLVVLWESNLDKETLVERCPNCLAPAVTLDVNGRIEKLNKQQYGATLHMRSDGTIFLQSNNLASALNGDKERLFKLVIDGKTGDMTIDGAGSVRVQASDEVYVHGRTMTTAIDEAVQETADSRVRRTNADDLESSLNKTIEAIKTLRLASQSMVLDATGGMTSKSDFRVSNVAEKDAYVVGSILGTVSGDRLVSVGGDDEESVAGSKSVSVGAALATTVTGGATISVGEDYSVTVAGSYSASVTGNYGVTVTGNAEIVATGTAKLTGSTVYLNNGVLNVARQTDSTQINASTDSAFIQFLADLETLLTDIVVSYNAHVHGPGNTPAVTGPTSPLVTTAVPTAPTTADGEITSGNATVQA